MMFFRKNLGSMPSNLTSRSFAIRQRLKNIESKCRSLPHILRSSQTVFLQSHEILTEQIAKSGPTYSL